jgi:hypothetical protein
MESFSVSLATDVFFAGFLVGYVIRALISARRRARATDAMISKDRNNPNDGPLRGFPLAHAPRLRKHPPAGRTRAEGEGLKDESVQP